MENLSTIDELTYKVEAARLERRNLRARLKAKPKFLPLAECKKWVQAWGRRWESEQEWREWIDMGEKRNAYIPSDPEEYYTRMGVWNGWDDFLFNPPS
ncbi:hypothetical protein TrRE_jg7668 [Triparma retinervis]|uniref:Uncharacterized protein n=1 Tax=Triparma retinervis TaxID=2557542 RepID=A0A9W7EFT0_9STRA|nr:hypothetical protein TrRE_jg7668 [Triparma retinervis]